MTEHLSSHTIELLVVRRLAPDELLPATRHLATCVECRQKASDAVDVNGRLSRFRTDLQTTALDTHLGYEQLEGYVDDSLDIKDRETVKQHLAACVACLKETHELELLRDNLKTYPAQSEVVVTSTQRQETSGTRLIGFLQMRPWRLAFLTAIVVLIALVTVLLTRRQAPQQLANENSAPNNTNAVTQDTQVAGANPDAANDKQAGADTGNEPASPYQNIIEQALNTQTIATPAVLRDLAGKDSKLLGST